MNQFTQAIETANRFINDGDAYTATYVLRDLPETKLAGLQDLAWAMCKDGALHKNDVLYFIESLEAWQSKNA